jgi:serine/threonine-protein kinase RsbW
MSAFPEQEFAAGTALQKGSPPGGLSVVQLSCLEEISPLTQEVAATMGRFGYARKDVFCVQLALEEALVNSIKHGHRNDPTKRVELRWRIDREHVFLQIEDEGEGFDPRRIPDPTAEDNLERSHGRGLFLMRSYMTRMSYNQRGNCLTLWKQRPANGLQA